MTKRVKKREISKEIPAGRGHSGLCNKGKRKDLLKPEGGGYLELKLRTAAWHVLVAQDTRRGPLGWCCYGHLCEGSMRLFLWMLERPKSRCSCFCGRNSCLQGDGVTITRTGEQKEGASLSFLQKGDLYTHSPAIIKHSPVMLKDGNGLSAPRKVMQRRQWQPTPVPLPGKSHGRRSLVGCHPWGCTELDTTEAT